MKTLVYANEFGTALTQHLGCTLLNNNSNGDGFVTKVTEIQDVWDTIICDNTVAPKTDATVYGYTPLSYRMNNEAGFASVMLEGAGLKLSPEKGFGQSLGAFVWIVNGALLGKVLCIQTVDHLMNRNLGARSPYPTGVIVWQCEDVQAHLKKHLQDILSDHPNYCGPLCVNFRLTSTEVYLEDLHFGTKPGWFEAARELLQGDLLTEGLVPSRNVAVGVLASLAPFPLQMKSNEHGSVNLPKQSLPHLGPMELQKQGQNLETQGAIGYVTAWGGGQSLEEKIRSARLRVYRTLRNVEAESLQYRTDVGSQTSQNHQLLLDSLGTPEPALQIAQG